MERPATNIITTTTGGGGGGGAPVNMNATTTTNATMPNQNSSANSNPTPRRHVLFVWSPISPDGGDLELKTRNSYQNLKQMIANKTPKERHETYAKYIAANPQLHTDELTMALLVAILVEQEGQNDYYGDVVAFSKDALNQFTMHMNQLICDKIQDLSQHSIGQIFWITRQLIKANVPAVENTLSNLIRQTAKGDLSQRNLFLAENLIDLFCDTRPWLVATTSFIGPTVVFNVMRLILDHNPPALKPLRKKETDFVIGLVRERFDFVLQIGKDFLRLLHYLAIKLPEFQALSQDIYDNNPKALSPKYEGPHQILAHRSPRRLFQSCLTYDMERKIHFLATNVNFGSQRRYQDWFNKQFLSGSESNLLRSDLIRYICTIIHPSNEVLCSNIIPRWAIIGWLLTTSIHVIANCRMALFLDWLSYDQTDNIMNIEPAILLMCHSVRSHPHVTACLLDFLCRAPALFHNKISEQIRTGIRRSLQQILEKRVLQSLKPIFICPKYDSVLRTMLKDCFPEYCNLDNGISQLPPVVVNLVEQSPTKVAAGSPTLIMPPPSALTPPLNELVTPVITPPPQANQVNPTIAKKLDMPKVPHVISLIEDDSMDGVANVAQQQQYDSMPKLTQALAEQNNIEEADRSRPRSPVIRTWAGGDPDVEHQGDLSDLQPKNVPVVKNQRKRTTTTTTTTTTTATATAAAAASKNHSNSSTTDEDSIDDDCMYRKGLREDDFDISETRVQYPFMEVTRLYPGELPSFSRCVCQLLEDLNSNRANPDAMIDLMSEVDLMEVFDTQTIETLGDCLANSIARDFNSRIFPSQNCDSSTLKDSILSPFFNLCTEAFNDNNAGNENLSRPMALLAYVGSIFKATGFLVIYYLRVQSLLGGSGNAENYLTFYNARYPSDEMSTESRWPDDPFNVKNHFEEDLRMMYDYDPEMLAFVLPTIFSADYTTRFDVTNNERLIRLAMSAVGPINLNELISYCMTGTTKIVSRDDSVQGLIKQSFNWPSWEQYNLWKIISAQSVAIESYLPLLEQLKPRQHAEAISSIMLNLQKIHEPETHIVESVIQSFGEGKEQLIASILRHWAMKTDVKELVKNIISHLDAPQVKRKGQIKSVTKPLSPMCCKTLGALDVIRLKAPKNKIFAQPELYEGLASIEPQCDEANKRKFAKLFDMQPKQTKKKKLDKE